MKLHLVGGFLGSGKTTAIIAAAKQLMNEGKKVGVITNDQGKYLVDTAFCQLNHVPAVEVTGGCFCCNYDDLDSCLDQLRTEVQPDVIFAESVGSCGDLVATVIKPLLELRPGAVPTSFSVFTDSRLLLIRLQGGELPFSENVVYIFDKQIEEAGLLVLNKIDLLSPGEVEELVSLVKKTYPEKAFHLQNSTQADHIHSWLATIDAGHLGLVPNTSIEMDYQRYGDGEAQLAWLDESLVLTVADGAGQRAVTQFIQSLLDQIRSRGAAIGHLKLMIQANGIEKKFSFTTLETGDWRLEVPVLPDERIEIILNARVEMEAENLRSIVRQAVEQLQTANLASVEEIQVDAFHPGFPRPTHRMK